MEMDAAVFHGIGRPLGIEHRPIPRPGPTEALLQIARCGVCASDLLITGDSSFALEPGTVLGHEYAGEIIETGSALRELRSGDRVAILPLRGCEQCAACRAGMPAQCARLIFSAGGYAQYCLVREAQCVLLPATVSIRDGALVEPLAVGLHGVALSGMPAGANVLVIGAGPIGLATTFWARRFGANRIVHTARSKQREELALQMGATMFIEAERLSAEQLAHDLGDAPDVVFECVGKPGLIAQSIELVRNRGTIVVLGLCMSPDHLSPARLVSKEIRIQASAFYTRGEFEQAAEALERTASLPRLMVTETIPLAELPAVFEAQRSSALQCKIHVHCTSL